MMSVMRFARLGRDVATAPWRSVAEVRRLPTVIEVAISRSYNQDPPEADTVVLENRSAQCPNQVLRGIAAVECALAAAAKRLRSGTIDPDVFRTVLAEARVCVQLPEQPAPALMVADLGARGRWVSVYSTPDRLAASVGEARCLLVTGRDLLAQLPDGVGVVIDPEDEHVVAIPGSSAWLRAEHVADILG